MLTFHGLSPYHPEPLQTHTRRISFDICNQRFLLVYSLVFELVTLHSLPEASRFVADAEAALFEADLLVLVHVGEDGAANRKVQSASVRLPALGVIHTSLTVDPHKPTYANTSQAEIRTLSVSGVLLQI